MAEADSKSMILERLYGIQYKFAPWNYFGFEVQGNENKLSKNILFAEPVKLNIHQLVILIVL